MRILQGCYYYMSSLQRFYQNVKTTMQRGPELWEHQRICQKGQRNVGMLEEDQKVRTLSRRGEDLASALMLHPHCRNQVSSISECRKVEEQKVEDILWAFLG